MIPDLTVIYYTANLISPYFMANTQKLLLDAIGDTPVISVSFKPTIVGPNCQNICIGEQQRSGYMLYKQIMIGVQAAKTKFVATAEDDTIYPREHFEAHIPDGYLGYNLNKWSIFTWTNPQIFSKRKGRRTMNTMIGSRDLLSKTLEERYSKYPVLEEIPPDIIKYYWGEPGRFEDHLGISKVPNIEFESSIPVVAFSTPEALAYLGLGRRKAHDPNQTEEIPYWGKASDIIRIYQP